MVDSRQQSGRRWAGQMVIPLVSFIFTLAVFLAIPGGSARAGGANPCGMKMKEHNPCSMKMKEHNPCSMKMKEHNPCSMKKANPCSMKMKEHNPCSMKKTNPCGAKNHNPCNPCGGAARVSPSKFVQPEGMTLAKGSKSILAVEGKKLWNDSSIGESGLACATCHSNQYGLMNESFAKPYPHRVAMPFDRAGVKQVNAAEMVNFCMVVPMKAKPLAWDSQQLAALAAYVETLQAGYHQVAPGGLESL